MERCSGDGMCLAQTGAVEPNDYEKTFDCPHKCQPIRCPNYLICEHRCPKWALDCNYGLDMVCAATFGELVIEKTDGKWECPKCRELVPKRIKLTGCAHFYCVSCFKNMIRDDSSDDERESELISSNCIICGEPPLEKPWEHTKTYIEQKNVLDYFGFKTFDQAEQAGRTYKEMRDTYNSRMTSEQKGDLCPSCNKYFDSSGNLPCFDLRYYCKTCMPFKSRCCDADVAFWKGDSTGKHKCTKCGQLFCSTCPIVMIPGTSCESLADRVCGECHTSETIINDLRREAQHGEKTINVLIDAHHRMKCGVVSGRAVRAKVARDMTTVPQSRWVAVLCDEGIEHKDTKDNVVIEIDCKTTPKTWEIIRTIQDGTWNGRYHKTYKANLQHPKIWWIMIGDGPKYLPENWQQKIKIWTLNKTGSLREYTEFKYALRKRKREPSKTRL